MARTLCAELYTEKSSRAKRNMRVYTGGLLLWVTCAGNLYVFTSDSTIRLDMYVSCIEIT